MKGSDMSDEPIGVSVNIIKGNSRLLEVKVHCIVRDDEGIPKWDAECVGRILIPSNSTPEGFVAEGPVETRIIPKGER